MDMCVLGTSLTDSWKCLNVEEAAHITFHGSFYYRYEILVPHILDRLYELCFSMSGAKSLDRVDCSSLDIPTNLLSWQFLLFS